jgi:hypothetical protein
MELTTSKYAVNVANMEVPEQVPKQVLEQEVPEQVVPKQSLPSTLSEGQVPKTDQSVPEQTMATTSSTQGGLPDAITKGKSAATSSITGLNRERKQAGAEQAAESDDDVVEESRGTHKTSVNMYTSAMNVETITSATRRSPSIRRRREWSGRQDDSSEKYR